MKPSLLTVLVLAVAAGCAAPTRTAAVESIPAVAQPQSLAASAGSLLDSMIQVNGCVMTRDGDAVTLFSPTGDRSLVQTAASFTPPFTVTLRGTTDSTNLRLYWNAGMVILNWECSPRMLRVHDPVTNATSALADKGWIEPKEWHTIIWQVRPDGMSITVDDELRFATGGDYSRISAPVGIGQAFGSVVSVESFEITQP